MVWYSLLQKCNTLLSRPDACKIKKLIEIVALVFSSNNIESLKVQRDQQPYFSFDGYIARQSVTW